MAEILEGTVEHITFSNESNGYTVCDVSSNGILICAVGCMPGLSVGEEVRLTGSTVMNPSYGEQFAVEMFERVMPKRIGSILMYLSSGVIKGIGEATAKKIVEKFGEDTLEVIASEPERLTAIRGISAAKAAEIHSSFMEKRRVQQTIMFLRPYSVSVELSMRVHKVLGAGAVSQIEENPYILCDRIPGIGFETADKIAKTLNIGESDIRRVKSGIRHVLLTVASQMGHTFIPEIHLTEYASRLLGVDEDVIDNACVALLKEGELYSFQSYDEGKCYQLAAYYNAERSIAKKLVSMVRTPTDKELSRLDKIIKLSEEKNNITLSEEQKTAVKTAVYGGITVITGGPGTGKTTIIKTILDCLDSLGATYQLAAPTGRAAKRMTDSCNAEAKTIHRLLETDFSGGDSLSFSRNEKNPIESDYVIIDEMSMVDTLLMRCLTAAIAPGTGLILLGDADQLPSVGAGSVLSDIIESDGFPTLKLTHIYRQAAESMIVLNAHKINSGETPYFNKADNDFYLVTRPTPASIADAIVSLAGTRLKNKYHFDPMTDIQVISPTKKSLIGTVYLNSRLQAELNPPSREKAEMRFGEFIFRDGDKVMQTENDYDMEWTKNGEEGSGIFNGDMGRILKIDRHSRVMTVLFDDGRRALYDFAKLKNLTLSYAITVHKSQGSEFECVIMPLHKCAPQLMTKNLFYTAVTRAKTLVVLVGVSEAAEFMVHNTVEQRRYSALTDRIADFL